MFWGDAEVPTVVPPVEQAVNSCQTNNSCYDYNSNSESFHDSCSNLNDSLGECGLSVGGTGGGRYDHLPKVLKNKQLEQIKQSNKKIIQKSHTKLPNITQDFVNCKYFFLEILKFCIKFLPKPFFPSDYPFFPFLSDYPFPVLSNLIDLKRKWWGEYHTYLVDFDSSGSSNAKTNVFNFDHVQEFNVAVNEEFLEHCLEGALSIEVYGHRWAENHQPPPERSFRIDSWETTRFLFQIRWVRSTRKVGWKATACEIFSRQVITKTNLLKILCDFYFVQKLIFFSKLFYL